MVRVNPISAPPGSTERHVSGRREMKKWTVASRARARTRRWAHRSGDRGRREREGLGVQDDGRSRSAVHWADEPDSRGRRRRRALADRPRRREGCGRTAISRSRSKGSCSTSNGTNPQPAFRAVVSCQSIESGVAVIVTRVTDPFPATPTRRRCGVRRERRSPEPMLRANRVRDHRGRYSAALVRSHRGLDG